MIGRTLRAFAIDDDPMDVELLQIHLSHIRDFTVQLQSGSEVDRAMQEILQDPPDVVFLDLKLGRRSGLDVLRALRREGFQRPIIIFTASGDTDVAVELLRSGATDYVSKQDLSPEVLTRAIRYSLDKASGEHKLAQTFVELAAARDDLASILDRLRLGVVMTDDRGRVTYLNGAGERLFGRNRDEAEGRDWEALCPAPEASMVPLRTMLTRPVERREKVTLQFETPTATSRWVDVEVHDEPRDPRRKILFFYDVSEVHDLRRELEGRSQFLDLVGRSEAIEQVKQQIRDLWNVDATVLVEGETGTGKELVARGIHDGSYRKTKPFVPVNCAGLGESLLTSTLFGHRRGAFTGAVQDHKGLFEAAEGGTIFLDEIGDVPMTVQTALLRVLQEREITRVGETMPRRIDVRVVTATNRNLADEVARGTFRMDLLYRIRVARIHLPSLRDRRSDIPILARHFLAQNRAKSGKRVDDISPEAMRELMAHDWPGNVRELKSCIEFAVIHCRREVLQAEDMPPEVRAGQTGYGMPRGDGGPDEKARIAVAIERAGGNRSQAARLLGVSRATFYRRLTELGLDAPPENKAPGAAQDQRRP
jgi:PAS domain S-box-containing protein